MTTYKFTVTLQADSRKEALRDLCRIIADAGHRRYRFMVGIELTDEDKALLNEMDQP